MTTRPLDLAQFEGHTPGPWHVPFGDFDYDNDGSRRLLYGDPNADIYGRVGTIATQAKRKPRGKNATRYDAPDAERDANSRLLAAAPALLAECKRQRAENARLRAEPIHALRTDIERLRDTLAHIASGLTEPHLEGGLTKTEAAQIARAALKVTP